jgi:hypothetical protein
MLAVTRAVAIWATALRTPPEWPAGPASAAAPAAFAGRRPSGGVGGLPEVPTLATAEGIATGPRRVPRAVEGAVAPPAEADVRGVVVS